MDTAPLLPGVDQLALTRKSFLCSVTAGHAAGGLLARHRDGATGEEGRGSAVLDSGLLGGGAVDIYTLLGTVTGEGLVVSSLSTVTGAGSAEVGFSLAKAKVTEISA